jgi:hypothetical protein
MACVLQLANSVKAVWGDNVSQLKFPADWVARAALFRHEQGLQAPSVSVIKETKIRKLTIVVKCQASKCQAPTFQLQLKQAEDDSVAWAAIKSRGKERHTRACYRS